MHSGETWVGCPTGWAWAQEAVMLPQAAVGAAVAFFRNANARGESFDVFLIMQPSEWHPWSVTTSKEIFLQPSMLVGNQQAWRSSTRIFACIYSFSKPLSSLQGCTIKHFHLLEVSVGLSSCTKALFCQQKWVQIRPNVLFTLSCAPSLLLGMYCPACPGNQCSMRL